MPERCSIEGKSDNNHCHTAGRQCITLSCICLCRVPLVNLNNVYILPGIPKLFQTMISSHQARFTGTAYQERSLYSVLGESFISEQVSRVASLHPKVSL